MIKAFDQAEKNEQPEAYLDCQSQCGLNTVMPLLANGEHIGFIGMRQRITDLVMEFSTATGIDIGILIPSTIDKSAHNFPAWGLYTAALTHAFTLKPLVHHLSNRFLSPEDISRDGWQPWNGSYYEFNFVPLKQFISGANGHLVFISDVTEAVSLLKMSNRNSFVLIMGSLILAELFLFLLLRKPLQRLSHLAKTLPLVARGHYREACQALGSISGLNGKTDEIDRLYVTSIGLIHQIEESQQALAADKDFIQSILDSVQVMITTQTRDGKLRTVNRYMSHIFGHSPDHLKKKLFIDLLQVLQTIEI